MNLSKFLLISLFLFCSICTSYAQADANTFKIGLWQLLFKEKLEVSLEHGVSDQWNIKGGAAYSWKQLDYKVATPTELVNQHADAGTLSAFLGARYFFQADKKWRWFAELDAFYEGVIWVDDIYPNDKPSSKVGVLVPFGINWQIFKKINFDFGARIENTLDDAFTDSASLSIDGTLFLKLGFLIINKKKKFK